jgi:hypothetical protein
LGPRAGLDTVVKRKTPQPQPGLKHTIIQPAAQRYTTELSRLLILKEISKKWNLRMWIGFI